MWETEATGIGRNELSTITTDEGSGGLSDSISADANAGPCAIQSLLDAAILVTVAASAVATDDGKGDKDYEGDEKSRQH